MKTLRLISFIVLLALPPALAQGVVYVTDLLKVCFDSDQGNTTSGRTECAKDEAERQQARMQLALNARRSEALDDNDRHNLHDIQKVCGEWRSARCSYVTSRHYSGSEAIVEAEVCIFQTTAERADELEAMQHPFMSSPNVI